MHLQLMIEMDDYLFVHAGIRSGIALERQMLTDLVEIREPFLSDRRPFLRRVVHGYTEVTEPVLLPHRISLDTGADATGQLTAAIIEGDGVNLFNNLTGLLLS